MGGDHADRPARLPVSSGDTEMELQPLQGSGSGDPSLMAQRWTDDPERGQNGAHAAGERKESRSQLQSRRRRELAQRWAARERCTVRAAVVAVASLALILVVNYFSFRQQGEGFVHFLEVAGGVADRARAHIAHRGAGFVATLQGRRFCPLPADPRLGQTERKQKVGDDTLIVDTPNPGAGHQRRVPPGRDALVTIMTPVFPDNATLSLLHNQLRSANAFVDMSTIHRWLFVTPRARVADLVAFLEDSLQTMPCIFAHKMEVVADDTCAPELRPRQLAAIAARSQGGARAAHFLSGWVKQQLVKLACAFVVETPFFLITDADTFFLRPLRGQDLVEASRCTLDSAVCDAKGKVQYRARNEMQSMKLGREQQEWMDDSAAALHLTGGRDEKGRSIGVTPQVLARPVLDLMAAHLETIAGEESWREYLLDIQMAVLYNYAQRHPQPRKNHAVPLLWHLWESAPGPPPPELWGWTEYDLYWVFAHNQSLWKKYHVDTRLQIARANLWHREELPGWRPCHESARVQPGYWAVVQSSLGLSGDDIWQHLAPCMDSAGDATAAAAAAVRAAKAQADVDARAAANKRVAGAEHAAAAARSERAAAETRRAAAEKSAVRATAPH